MSKSKSASASSVAMPGDPPPPMVFGDIHNLKNMHKRENDNENDAQKEQEDKFGNGPIGRLAKNPLFEQVTIGVILLNAISIGYDADYSARWVKPDNLYEGPIGFIICEVSFCVYFTLEILIRFFGYRLKRRCLCDAWFVFDSALVSMMVVETAVLPFVGTSGPLGSLSVLRLLRLLRITRMAKLMRAFPQLLMIVKGISAAVKAVGWTAVLLVIITYTWAILFTSQYHQGWKSDEEVIAEGLAIEEFFGSMGKSMLSLLVMGTILDDVTACSDAIRATGSTSMLICFLLYILLNSFTMMNMLVGILVEVVGNTSESEKEAMIEESVRESIMTIFVQMDTDQSGKISRDEFLEMKRDPKVMKALEELDIREKQFDMYVELLFNPFEAETDDRANLLSFQELLDCICRLRPGAMVSALDFAAFRESVLHHQSASKGRLERIENMCSSLNIALEQQQPQPQQQQQDWQQQQHPQQQQHHQQQRTSERPQKINAAMLAELERTASCDVIAELQRRLGITCLEETGVPLHMMDEELQARVKAAEAFQMPCVPDAPSHLEALVC